MLVSPHRNRCASRNHNNAPQMFLSFRSVIRHNFGAKRLHSIGRHLVVTSLRKLLSGMPRRTASLCCGST